MTDIEADPVPVSFQSRASAWARACFGESIATDITERNYRFLEEALELVQATGCTEVEAHALVDYVFGRKVGEPRQETGGAIVTLALLCDALRIDMLGCGEQELARIWTKIAQIREKQARKEIRSPLPGKD